MSHSTLHTFLLASTLDVGACSYVNRGQQVNLHGTVIFYTPKSQYNWLNIHVLYQQRGFWRITSIRILILHLLTHLANDAVFPSQFTIILQFSRKHLPFWISFYIIYQHTFHVFLPIRASEQHSAPYIIRFFKIFILFDINPRINTVKWWSPSED